jgi:methyl-accepting chemotaxis protein
MRKFYYLNPTVQHSFTSFYTFLTAIEIILFGILVFVIEHLNLHSSSDIQIYIRFSLLLLLVLIFSGFNFWLGMRLSHRIVGPMIQIQRVLEKAIKNDFQPRIQLRANDHLYEIGDQLNLLLEKLEKQNKQNE